MRWIKVMAGSWRKPEVYHIARVLKIPPKEVMGCLFIFWEWADENIDSRQFREGHAVVQIKKPYEVIDAVVQQSGFAAALREAGWIVEGEDEEEIILPNWGRHNGSSVKNRAIESERNRTNARKGWEKRKKSPVSSKQESRPPKPEPVVMPAPAQKKIKRPTLALAKQAAPQLGVTPEEAELWWHTREGADWKRPTSSGSEMVIGERWQSDMKSFALRVRENATQRQQRLLDGGSAKQRAKEKSEEEYYEGWVEEGGKA